eukprot:4328178-Pleurochrysis_carterae.AAC.9
MYLPIGSPPVPRTSRVSTDRHLRAHVRESVRDALTRAARDACDRLSFEGRQAAGGPRGPRSARGPRGPRSARGPRGPRSAPSLPQPNIGRLRAAQTPACCQLVCGFADCVTHVPRASVACLLPPLLSAGMMVARGPERSRERSFSMAISETCSLSYVFCRHALMVKAQAWRCKGGG